MNDCFLGMLLTVLATFIVAFIAGWAIAHHEVATECKRQGSFYVGQHDFVCHLKATTGELP